MRQTPCFCLPVLLETLSKLQNMLTAISSDDGSSLNSGHMDSNRICQAGDGSLQRAAEVTLGGASTPKFSLNKKQGSPVKSGSIGQNFGGTGVISPTIGSAPVSISEEATVMEACQLMAARRADALLVVNHPIKMGLTGIFTDKDLAYRVIAEGLDPRSTPLSKVMTHNPITFSHKRPLSEGLEIMVQKHFRHLPVIDDVTGAIIGLLDITQCMKEALETLERADKMAKNLNFALDLSRQTNQALSTNSNDPILTQASQLATILSERFAAPTLSTLFSTTSKTTPFISLKSTVLEAAKFMRDSKETAVLLVDDSKNGALVGIFTSKDMVLRVIAA
jgi:CBS domain-containing protein